MLIIVVLFCVDQGVVLGGVSESVLLNGVS